MRFDISFWSLSISCTTGELKLLYTQNLNSQPLLETLFNPGIRVTLVSGDQRGEEGFPSPTTSSNMLHIRLGQFTISSCSSNMHT